MTYVRTCEQCGEPIPPFERSYVYCSNACKQRAYRRRRGVPPRHLSDGVVRDKPDVTGGRQ